MARAGESHKRPQKDEKKAVCRRSEHHNVFIGCQHQRCPYYCLGQRTGATLSLGNACLVCGFPTFSPRSTAKKNGLE